MKANPFMVGSTYIFVLMVMLTLFLLIIAVMGVTASGRRISGYYVQFAGLYDLALAGNERALFILCQEVRYHSQIIIERAHHRLYEDGIENHLIYRDGEFLLGDHFLRLFREEKNEVLVDFLADNFSTGLFRDALGQSHTGRYFSYSLGVGTGVYDVRTYLFEPRLNSYRVRSTANKFIGGQPGIITAVYGRIEWPAFTHQTVVIPVAYAWRSTAPARFTTGAYSFADFPGNFAGLPIHYWRPENTLHITSSSLIDVQNFSGAPTLIIYTGFAPLHIYGASVFNGIILSRGDVYVENVTIKGSVIVGGAVHLVSGAFIEPTPDMLFSVSMTEEFRHKVFDVLGLTRFNQAGAQTEDIAWLLRYVKITDFELDIDPLDDFMPQLIQVQQIAN